MADVTQGRVHFPLAWKLSLVVSAILVFSLGIIILSVWLLFRFDAAASAAADNDSINFRVAAAAESTLEQIRSETILLLNSIHAETTQAADSGGNAAMEKLGAYYFERNPGIAAVVSIRPGGGAETMINAGFIRSNEMNDSLVAEYLNMRGSRLLRDDSETLLVNASRDFYGLPMLAARFTYTVGDSVNLAPSVAIVLFSSGELADYLGYGASQSVLLSSTGETLIQPGDPVIANPAAHPALRQFYSGGVDHITENYRGEFIVSARRIDFGAALLTVIPGSVIFEGINATTRRNLYLAASVWFISLLFINLFSSGLTRQLRLLKEAAEAIENGMYRRAIRGKVRDETGYLAERMNSMRIALLNFERFTNKQTARLTHRGILKPGGTVKNAVFLFTDIRSFTAISERLDPADVVSFLNDYMERMVACIMATGGVIDKFIGDAILAHWGAITEETPLRANADGPPVDEVESHIRAAFRSALLMRAALQCFNSGHSGTKRPYIKAGCGISSGRVAAGLIGTDERLVYTVIGEAVNLAEQAEARNKSYGTEILVSAHTLEMTGDDFIAETLPGLTDTSAKLRALINVKGEDETKRLTEELESLSGIDGSSARHFIGEDGPKTLRELRVLLGISEPELSKVQNEREKKFKVQKS